MPALQIKLFAILRERFDTDSLVFEASGASLTAGELVRQLQVRFPDQAHLISLSRLAINHRFAAPEEPVGPADELALIPPVSGG
jgi:molybdopterin converting factor small subunit